MTRSAPSLAATTGAALLIGAGVLHYVLAPTHMAEARGQGLFFLVLATVQVVLGFLALRHLSARVSYAAILVSGASIAVYVLALVARPPFGEDSDPVDLMGLTTKVLELATLVVFVYLLRWRAKVMVPRPRRAVAYLAIAVVASLLLGGATFAAGYAAEPVAPWLKEGESHTHGAAEEGHTHTHEAASPTSSDPHAGHATSAPR